MTLPGKLFEEIEEALLAAFPKRDDLIRMVRIELDENLEAIADGENLRSVVFNLVSWAEQRDMVDALVQGALRQNQKNPVLQQLLKNWSPTTSRNSDQMGKHIAPVSRSIDKTIHQQFGLNADEVSALVSRLIGALRDAPQANSAVALVRANLDNLYNSIAVLVEYKEVHDLLQQIELAHRIVYSLVCEQDMPLPAAQIRWRSLIASQSALEMALDKLCNYVVQASFGADASWTEELRLMPSGLRHAADTRNVDSFVDILDAIHQTIGRETSRFNDRLIGAVDALRIPQWVQALRQVHDAMPSWVDVKTGQSEHLDAFGRDVDALDKLAARLQFLRDTHDAWQQVDNALRSEEMQLVRNIGRFRRRWSDHLVMRVRALYADSESDWAHTLELTVWRMEERLPGSITADIADALHECRGAVLRRFAQINFELRLLCQVLMKASEPIGEVLEQLS